MLDPSPLQQHKARPFLLLYATAVCPEIRVGPATVRRGRHSRRRCRRPRAGLENQRTSGTDGASALLFSVPGWMRSAGYQPATGARYHCPQEGADGDAVGTDCVAMILGWQRWYWHPRTG